MRARLWLWLGSLLLPWSLGACGQDAQSSEALARTAAEGACTEASTPLEPAFLGEALRALRPYSAAGETVLEVRARSHRVALQVRVADTSTIAEYVYDGRVLGPSPTHIAGSGDLESNLFDLESVDFDALGRLFPVARASVDPLDGRVTELVVRRGLPFQRDVRARIYVDSPRLRGHLDADGKGTPLSPPGAGAAGASKGPPRHGR